jgi:predicted amidohydrolase YtcJ
MAIIMRTAVLALAAAALGFQVATPDLILVNGKVFTADPAAPWAEALAIHGSQIVAVGTSAAIRAAAGGATRVLDVGGRVVIPGINDAHTHVGARPPGVVLSLRDDPTFEEVIAATKTAVASAKPTDWIYGTIGERALTDARLTRYALDAAAPGRIVKLAAWTGHGNVLSTAAMRTLGIGDRDVDPPFGRYGRTPNGVVNGVLEEYADTRANRVMTTLAGRDAAIASLRRLAEEAIGYGITTIQAMSNAIPATELAAMLPSATRSVRWRVIRFPLTLAENGDVQSYARIARQPASLVTVSGVKFIVDGTPVERLSAMNEPYLDRKDWTGRLNLSPEELELLLRRSLASGQQLMLHITGDRAIDTLFAAMEKIAPPGEWQRARVRIEHGEFVSGRRLERARRLGVVVVQNPAHFTLGETMKRRFGTERGGQAQAVKSIVQAGVLLALGGDGVLNPYLNMMLAVTHPGNPGQALTREQVIAAYTTGSAYAEFTEREKGRITRGMVADVAVLTQDVFTVPVNQLTQTRAAVTIVNGRVARYSLDP